MDEQLVALLDPSELVPFHDELHRHIMLMLLQRLYLVVFAAELFFPQMELSFLFLVAEERLLRSLHLLFQFSLKEILPHVEFCIALGL